MRIAEFIVRRNTFRRRVNLALGIRLTAAFAFTVSAALVSPLLEPSLLPMVGDTWAELLAALPVFLAFAIPLATFFPVIRRIERQFGVRCPACNLDLHLCSAVVIASRNCPCCGATVILGD